MDSDRQQTRPARVFVGRLPELHALNAALAAAQAGEPQVVLIQGKGGLGKSSLTPQLPEPFLYLGDIGMSSAGSPVPHRVTREPSAAVSIAPVVYIKDVDLLAVVVDRVPDPVLAAAGTPLTFERGA